MKKIKTHIKIPSDILEIQKLFSKNNKKLYVVGGAVRDHLLGKKPNDFDLVTDAIPDEVISILEGYNTDLQGAHFGVVRVFTDNEPEGHEIASFRLDISKGRDNKSDSEKVEIGEHITIEDDVKRRDLTINALFYDIESNEIVDLVGGIDDLNNKIIRTVGIPCKRFNEDRLRILRCFRFASTMNFNIDINTLNAINDDNKLFGISEKDDVSKERIIAEFIKTEQKCKNNSIGFVKYFDYLHKYSILDQLFPNININPFKTRTNSLILMLSQLFINNNVDNLFINKLKESKLPNKMINNIIGLLSFKNGVDENNVYELKKIQKSKHIDNELLYDWWKLCGLKFKNYNNYITFNLTVSGNDVMNDGFKGKNIANEIQKREKENYLKHINNEKNR